jgi:hypothetical protein
MGVHFRFSVDQRMARCHLYARISGHPSYYTSNSVDATQPLQLWERVVQRDCKGAIHTTVPTVSTIIPCIRVYHQGTLKRAAVVNAVSILVAVVIRLFALSVRFRLSA